MSISASLIFYLSFLQVIYASSFQHNLELKGTNPGVKKDSSATRSNEEGNELKPGYYLVTGVFSHLENIKRYNKDLASKGYDCKYSYSKSKNRYYSYILHTESVEAIKSEYKELKDKHDLWDFWILKVDHTSSEKNMAELAEHLEKTHSGSSHESEAASGHSQGAGYRKAMALTHNSYELNVTVYKPDGKEISNVPVRVVHGESAKVLATVHSDENTVVYCPKSENSQNVQLICEIFGYHKTSLNVNLKDPVTPETMNYVKLDGNVIRVNLTLQSCKKGDIMVMYNVFFHPNTNIMRMKSNYDLQTLMEILNENPKLKICIHGHTNGNSSGPITKITDNCDNFFNPTETENISGSSTKLSLLRATAIEQFLLKQGIDADRMEVKGWGGKKMLYKEDSPMYEYNVRVEVEILED